MMDWVDWMGACDKWHREHRVRGVCTECGGSGIKAICCCSGFECGCYGYPYAFDFCDYCETPWPSAVPRPDDYAVDALVDENLRSVFT